MADQTEFLQVDREVYRQWCTIGQDKDLASHSLIAAFLIQSYQSSQWDKKCVHCNKALVPLCLSCHGTKGPDTAHGAQHPASVSGVGRGSVQGAATDATVTRSPDGGVSETHSSEGQQVPACKQEGFGVASLKYTFTVAGTESKSEVSRRLCDVSFDDDETTDIVDSTHSDSDDSVSSATQTKEQTQYHWQQSMESEQKTKSRGPESKKKIDKSLNKRDLEQTSSDLAFRVLKMTHLEEETDAGGTIESMIEKSVKASEILVDGRKEFCCVKCGQRFFQMYKMKRHFQTHVNYRPHPCPHCPATFHQHYHLQRHVNNKHPFMLPPHPAVRQVEEVEEEDKGEEHDEEEMKSKDDDMEFVDNMIVVHGVDSFSCKQCGKAFSQRCSLEKHVRSHSHDGRYCCKQCGRAFNRLSHLKRHMKQLHQSLRPFVCSLCSATFTDSYHLSRHEATHTNYQPYKCPECSSAFTNTRQLKCHLNTHLTDGADTGKEATNAETRCGDVYVPESKAVTQSGEKSLLKHSMGLQDGGDSTSMMMKGEMDTGDPGMSGSSQARETSSFFQPSFSERLDMQAHGKQTSEAKETRMVIKSPFSTTKKGKKRKKKLEYKCTHPGCSDVLPTQSGLDQHLCSHAEGGSPTSDTYRQGLTGAHTYRRHKYLQVNTKPFVCQECGSTFGRYSHLAKHMRQHSGERPYVCSICGASFLEPFHLKRHNKIHTGERPYMCEWCGASFIQAGEVKTHIMAMHTNDRPHQCCMCDKAYTTACMLKVHMRSHTGERPYICSTCGAGFRTISHLKDHQLTHTGEKPKQCPLCPLAYTRTNHLTRHMMKVHPGVVPVAATHCARVKDSGAVPAVAAQSVPGKTLGSNPAMAATQAVSLQGLGAGLQ